jgi:hypothetical protein
LSDSSKSRDRSLEEAVSRAVRDNLPPLKHSLEELQEAFADLVSACSSTRPINSLPAMLRVQAIAASLNASLSVLSTFIASAMQRRERELAADELSGDVRAVGVLLPPPAPPEKVPLPPTPTPMASSAEAVEEEIEEEIAEPEAAPEPEAVTFDVASLPHAEQELHKRANRVAKVSMQDIKMLKPEEVRKGCEQKDICVRLRPELDKARKEYDRRFHKILDHPVDYFHHWVVEVLAGGDPEALGEYPYPSPVVRR